MNVNPRNRSGGGPSATSTPRTHLAAPRFQFRKLLRPGYGWNAARSRPLLVRRSRKNNTPVKRADPRKAVAARSPRREPRLCAVALDCGFAAAADDINADFRRRLSGLHRGIPQHERAAAIRAAREWRDVAMTALQRDCALRRRAARRRQEDQLIDDPFRPNGPR